jgi:hypothetical protein
MNIFSKLFNRNNQSNKQLAELSITSTADNDVKTGHSMNFRVTPAQGGILLSFSRYNRPKDRNDVSLYIITDNKDYAEEIGRIVAMELYKQ